jgi:hypothetical protein
MVARIDVILLFPYRMTSILFTAVYIRPHGGDPNTEHGSCTQHARRGGKKKIKVDVGNTCLNPEVMEKPIETLLSTLTKLESLVNISPFRMPKTSSGYRLVFQRRLVIHTDFRRLL